MMNDRSAFPGAPSDSRLPTPEMLDLLAAGRSDQSTTDKVSFDLRLALSALYRNFKTIAAIVGVALMLGLAVTLLSTPVYRAVSRIQIDQQASKVLSSSNDEVSPAASSEDADRYLQTQLDIIQSRSLAERVAAALGLFRNNDFLIAMKVKPDLQARGAFNLRQTLREQVLDVIGENLTTKLPVNSRIVEIGFTSPDRVLAASISNSFADNMIVANLDRKFNASSYARDFLQKQLDQTRQKLEQSERNIIDYARSSRLVDVSSGTGGETAGPRSLTASTLVQLNTALSQALASRIAAQQHWIEAQSTSVMQLPEVLSNPTIQDLLQQRAKAKAEYSQQGERRQSKYPAMVQAAAQIAELDSQIAQLSNNIKLSIREQYQVAQNQEDELLRKIAGLKSDTLDEQKRGVRYNILQREVDTNRALYDGLLQRYKEVSAAAGITANNISVVDRSEPPIDPIRPRPIINMLFALIGGLVCAAGLILLREHFDDRIRSGEDVDRKLGLPFLGSVPAVHSGSTPMEELVLPRSPMSEAYYALRSALELSFSGGVPKSLMFTSSQPGEGKSTSSYAIASDFARIGKKVLLVDSDLRRPSLHGLIGLGNDSGFSNLLAGQKRFSEVVQAVPNQPKLDVVTSGTSTPNPAEILAGPMLSSLLSDLEKIYDLIIFDAPPVLGLADAPSLSARVNGVIFVVEANRAHRGQAKIALRRMRSANAHLIGAVLTKFDARAIGYHSDYIYSYDYGSGSGRAGN
jgi:succinoglycan biosynthesis transport protein ExoP